MPADEAENLRCPKERGDEDGKFTDDNESIVDTEPRLSNASVGSLSTSDIGGTCVTW